MGIVAYSNDTKASLLKIPKGMLRRYGAVSDPVVKTLARQARKLGKSDLGLGVTGLLGPGGGTKKKPVGLVYLALASSKRCTSQTYHFAGNREAIRLRVVRAALDLLRRELK